MITARPNNCESCGTQFSCKCEKLEQSTGSRPGRGRNRTGRKAECDKFCPLNLVTAKLSSHLRRSLEILLLVMILGRA
jgi:hypothetical protein